MQAAQEGLSHELTFSSCAETITCSQEACLLCKTRQFSDVGSYDKHAKESNLKKRNMPRGEVSPKDASCKLRFHLVTSFVPKAAGKSTFLQEASPSVTPCGEQTSMYLQGPTYLRMCWRHGGKWLTVCGGGGKKSQTE